MKDDLFERLVRRSDVLEKLARDSLTAKMNEQPHPLSLHVLLKPCKKDAP